MVRLTSNPQFNELLDALNSSGLLSNVKNCPGINTTNPCSNIYNTNICFPCVFRTIFYSCTKYLRSSISGIIYLFLLLASSSLGNYFIKVAFLLWKLSEDEDGVIGRLVALNCRLWVRLFVEIVGVGWIGWRGRIEVGRHDLAKDGWEFCLKIVFNAY